MLTVLKTCNPFDDDGFDDETVVCSIPNKL